MQLVALTVVGVCAMVTGYALGLGGPVVTLIFLSFVFTGVLLRVAKPVIDWVTGP
jgi:hypothetical protein